MKKFSIVILLVISLALGGCAGMSDTEQRTLSGGAIGTGAGAVIGAIAGHTVWGGCHWRGSPVQPAAIFMITTRRPNRRPTTKPTMKATRPARRTNKRCQTTDVKKIDNR